VLFEAADRQERDPRAELTSICRCGGGDEVHLYSLPAVVSPDVAGSSYLGGGFYQVGLMGDGLWEHSGCVPRSPGIAELVEVGAMCQLRLTG
jgi:hypothetical protein